MSKLLLLHSATPQQIAGHILDQPKGLQLSSFNALPFDKAIDAFQYLGIRTQKAILSALPPESVARILHMMAPDDRTSLLQELPEDICLQLLKYLSPPERALSIKLLGYSEGSVGRLMTPDYIAIRLDWTVKDVLDYIRVKGKDKETINVVYAVDQEGVLVDDFRIRQFLLHPLDCQVKTFADHHFIALHVDDDESDAINTFRKYERVALPVVDSKNVLLGIVTFDDILHVSTENATEDFQMLGGVESFNEPYMEMPLLGLVRKRIGWLVVLFFGEMLTASAMGYFQDEIAKAVVLALFLPLIISSGGNAGSQASTLIIRAMALGEVKLKDVWRILRRELLSGLLLGVSLGAIGFFRVTLWSAFSPMYGVHWLLIALTIFLSLIGVVLWGTVSGAMLPLILRRLGFDPAASSAPFVATIVDVTGLIIYFTVAFVVLKGTLL